MNKQELAEKLSEKFPELPKAKMVELLETMTAIITETIKAGGEVTFAPSHPSLMTSLPPKFIDEKISDTTIDFN